MEIKPVEILLVEDSPADIRLTQEALKGSKIRNHLHIVTDGEEAMDFLQGRGSYAGMPRPDIILLDLNLPRKNGHEVLKEIKEDTELRRIPVVILTTSDDEHDVLKSYDLYANCYITKPLSLERFGNIVQHIEDFWLTIVRLPPE
jgi:CheY-like chemotaxis protein